MPYMLSDKAERMIGHHGDHAPTTEERRLLAGLTDLQRKAILYYQAHPNQWLGAHEVATFYGYSSGIYFRGVLASLHQQDLLIKIQEKTHG